MNNNYRAALTGLILGDALGVPVQFYSRETIKNRPQGPVTGMESGGVFQMPKGTWSDDGSMTLATYDSIKNKGAIDPEDIMQNFVEWEVNGKYTQHGQAFDQGNTCSAAIYHYIEHQDIHTCGATEAYSNGNGSLMRILPVCIYYALKQDVSEKEIIESIHIVSGLTHNHLRSKMACGLYYFMVKELVESDGTKGLKELLQQGIDKGVAFYRKDEENERELAFFSRLFNLDELEQTDETDIKSSGYVIDTIEAVVWCLIRTGTFADCLLLAVNLGDDADTVGAIAGGLAGLYYGVEGMPKEWIDEVERYLLARNERL